MKRVKVWPTVPIKVREGAEEVAGTNLAKRRADEPKSVNGVLESWLVLANAIRTAKNAGEVMMHVERLRGKPLALPSQTEGGA